MLPLYSPRAAPDGSHQVAAPGGYEHWTFFAESNDAQTLIAVTFAHGFAFHPGYLRADARYRRRPTRVAPPMPADYTCVSLAVYADGRRIHRSITHFPAPAVSTAAGRLDLRIGPNFCRRDHTGRIHLVLGGKASASGERVATAELEFAPRFSHAPLERRWAPATPGGTDHVRVVADLLCDVAGEFRATGGERPLPFRGRGYCDHHFGTGTIGRELKRWLCGAALLSDRAYLFQIAQPRDPSLPEGVQLLRADGQGVREIDGGAMKVRRGRRAGLLLTYPAEISAGDELRLVDPRVVDRSPYGLRIQYAAMTSAGSETARAFCEVVDPRRPGWPLLGRWMERSIDRAEGESDRGGR